MVNEEAGDALAARSYIIPLPLLLPLPPDWVEPTPVVVLNVSTCEMPENTGDGVMRTYRRSAEITAVTVIWAPSGKVIITG